MRVKILLELVPQAPAKNKTRRCRYFWQWRVVVVFAAGAG